MSEIAINDLTTGSLDGTGIFDELMRSVGAHIHEEYSKNRIKGPEYSTVYLGAVQSAMDRALQFLLAEQRTDLEAQLLEQQIINAGKEGLVLDAQKCKLDAEFDLINEQRLKAVAETAVLNQKKITEQAQTSGTGVDSDSVIGKQKTLYTHQADGFLRDAEQKGARLLVDTWNTRRMTDETGTGANADNQLDDIFVGRAVSKVLTGINA